MSKISRRLFILAPTVLLAACASAPPTPFAPAAGQPTFIFFYAPG